MKKLCLIASVILMTLIGTSLVVANQASEGEGYCITISPNTLVLSSKVTLITVHSNIPYSLVNTSTLTLNGIPASSSKADDCGDLVVKFSKADIQGIVEPGIAFLTLSGEFKDGSVFETSDTITVKK